MAGVGHIDIDVERAVVALLTLLTLQLTVVLILLAAVARSRPFRDAFNLRLWWCCPTWYLPDDTGEALQLEATLLPLATWLACSIEGSKTSVDSTLVGFGSKFVCSGAIGSSWSSARVVD